MQKEENRIEIMNSSEMGFSGNSSGFWSNFSKTCSVLSQFLKEKGSFDELSLSLSKKPETKIWLDSLLIPFFSESEIPATTMNLFPGSSDPAPFNIYRQQNVSKFKPDPESGPLTIFYMGQVVVFKDFPADKAREIMNMANKSSGRNLNQHVTFSPPHAAESPAESATSTQINVPTLPIADLPIARKHSLARFLEKRKDRITASAPYQANKIKELGFKPVKAESWLGMGLAPESDILFQMQRH